MKKIKNVLTEKNIGVGYLYFYIHLITEIICFYSLSKLIGDSIFLWLCPLIYDAFAFVPQGLIGLINDKVKKINFALIGMILMIIGLLLLSLFFKYCSYVSIFIIAIGNACVHVRGAELTLRTSNGKAASSAIFVGGGSFGVITGKLFAKLSVPYLFIIFLALTSIPFILLAETYNLDEELVKFNYENKKIKPELIIIFATLLVIIRGFMGYGLPTSWNKTFTQTIILFFIMGFGKCLGGILIDLFDIKKVAYISILGALPFLLIGDNYMFVSLIGVMFFSMTMAVTLMVLVSVLKKNPGVAFGFTTIGLFLGSLPIFFFRITNFYFNIIIIILLTLLALLIAKIILGGHNEISYK